MENLPPKPEHQTVYDRLTGLLEALYQLHAAGHRPLYLELYPVDPDDAQAGYTVDGSEH